MRRCGSGRNDSGKAIGWVMGEAFRFLVCFFSLSFFWIPRREDKRVLLIPSRSLCNFSQGISSDATFFLNVQIERRSWLESMEVLISNIFLSIVLES